MQGPHGRQFTVNVTGNTEWDNSESISSLTTSSIVAVSGMLDKADATIDADEVAILSQNGFYATGQVTYVTPATGTATSFNLYVRGLLPTTTSLVLGQIATVDVSSNTELLHLPGAQHAQPVPLQRQPTCWLASPSPSAARRPESPAPRSRPHAWCCATGASTAPSSQAPSTRLPGTFQMTINGFAGLLVPQTVTVYTSGITTFRNGFTALQRHRQRARGRPAGQGPLSGNTVLIARYVDVLN